MASANKIASLKKYIEDHKNRLTAPVPEKRKNNPEAYREYLRLEITKAQRKVDKLSMEGK